MPERPNFLFLITDQHRADHTGFGGNPVLRTPHLDGLAARGAVFDRAHVANPICMPNRSSIMTGRMPSVHGTRYNGISLDWRANTFVRVLREHGYRTSHIGKSHLQNMGVGGRRLSSVVDLSHPADATAAELPEGWDRLENFERYRGSEPVPLPDDFYGFERADFAVLHGDLCSGHYYRWLRAQGVEPRKLQGLPNARARYADWDQVYQTALPVDLYPSSYVAQRAVEEVEAASRDGRPFFLHCSWPDPHHPFTPPGEYWERYSPGEIPVPESFGDPLERAMPHHRALRARRGQPPRSTEVWAPSEAQLRHAAAAEYGMIELIDDGVGRILQALDANGRADDTVVVFTSDHGDMFGDHGLLLKHAIHYEGCTRVPFVIARPGARPSRTNALASSVDLAQTLLELAGLPEYRGMQGHSLVPVLDDAGSRVRNCLLIEEDEKEDYLGVGRNLRMRTLLTDEARLTLYASHEHGELFDLAADPLERDNLYGTPRGADLQTELERRLLQEMMRVADDSPRPTHSA